MGAVQAVMRRVERVLVVVVGVLGGEAAAGERADLELVLLADASGSIDDGEIRFQRRGYAAVITDLAVLAAIAQGHDRPRNRGNSKDYNAGIARRRSG